MMNVLSATPPPLVPEALLKALHSPAFRMPTEVLPQHYALEFQPDAQHDTFVGSAYITMRVRRTSAAPLSHVVLHALDLRITASAIRVFMPHNPSSVFDAAALLAHPSHHLDEASRRRPFSTEEGRYVACQRVQQFDVSETVLLYFATPLSRTVGDIFVLIIDRFDGVIAAPPVFEGLFHGSCRDATVLSTHLEPTGARRLYPCFDEPALQTTFQLSVIAAAEQTVMSNTEVEADIAVTTLPYAVQVRPGWGQEPGNPHADVVASFMRDASCFGSAPSAHPWHRLRFQKTSLLHTCVVGFHVGRFIFLEQLSKRSRVLCRVVLPDTEPGSSGWFALDLVTKALDFFEDFFNVQLPLKKLDVIAVETFCTLGMGHWGMIRLRKDHLVVTEKTPLERRQDVARLIGHAICHQWFGNWITIEWWDSLWLKEGMCRYLEYVFVNAVFPGWGVWNRFLYHILGTALLADAKPSGMHSVNYCNSSPRCILDSFDSINYNKGACVLRMLFTTIGVEWLRRATHLLLTRFAGSSFNIKDLEDCIIDTVDEDCSGEVSEQYVKAICSCLRMVETVSHPYLYIHQKPGQSCTITQYNPPSRQHGFLGKYLQQQHRRADEPSINLFSAPTCASFEWTPETTLSRVTTPFSLPLRAVELTPSGHGAVHLLFLEEVEHYFACSASAPTLTSTNGTPLTQPAAMLGHPGAATSATPETEGFVFSQQCRSSSPLLKSMSPVLYFNEGGGGFLHCDYDAATWRRLFEYAAFFSEGDHMRITMHFIHFARAQLGHQPGDTGDRCTLFFEWILRLTNTPGAMNSFLWELVTYALTTLVQLVQQYYCHSIVKDFVNSLYMPLQRRCMLSFFAQERTVSFQSSTHLSRELVLRILQLLSLCNNLEVVEEAKEAAQWSLAALLLPGDVCSYTSKGVSNTTAGVVGFGSSVSGGDFVNPSTAWVSPGLVHSSHRCVGGASPLSPDNPTPRGSGTMLSPVLLPVAVKTSPRHQSAPMCSVASACPHVSIGATSSPVKALNVSCASLSGRLAFSAPRSGQCVSSPSAIEHGGGGGGGSTRSSISNNNSLFATPCKNLASGVKATSPQRCPCHRIGDFNIDDISHVQAGAIALSHLVTQGHFEYWVAAAALAVEVLRLDRDELQRVGGMPVPLPRLAIRTQEQRHNILRLVLPPIFALDKEVVFPFMAKVFDAAPILESSGVLELYRNPSFFVHLLSSQGLMIDRRTLSRLIQQGATVCGNGYVVSRLRLLAEADSAIPTSLPTPRAEQYQGIRFELSAHLKSSTSSLNVSAQPSSPPTTPRNTALPDGSTLPVLSSPTAEALECMELNCVWMDYCCSYYDQFLREQLHRKAWRSGCNSTSFTVSVSTPLGDGDRAHSETVGGVSI
ncbi:hypothetical protein JKF63_07538 [Porcisia hertigi]|uniref:Puromycin-sensitive aminopeptidase-like protein n=1 Tax=Porcisia hertigi TaxID=2761500 RepID=A0A836IZM0_9TRYP|nr:hypothetical protein JKF63_07538 [Porcisia hertigi]